MVSAFILVLTIGALEKFLFAYCRTLQLTHGRLEISARTREVSGISIGSVDPEEFSRLMVLLRVAPDSCDDAAELRAVSAYYRIVQLASWLVSPLSGAVRRWSKSELARCSRLAAVALDRRLVPATE